MTSSKTTNTYNRQNWEDSDFPILCNTCLGENPYIRMLKDRYGKECKICSRPFTSFRWCPGPKARYKNTEVCQTCAKLKNVCQTCIFDLEFGLPVQVRDKAIKAGQILPKSDVNREYFMQQAESEMQLTGDNSKSFLQVTAGGKAPTPSDMLMKLARTTPYYRRNLPHICSFWVKGKCARGEECPYRHENPTDPDDPLSDQNIKDRFYGTADPVAEKLMRRYDAMPKLEPPQDKTITTLYIGGLVSSISEKELRDFFYQFGEIRSVSLHLKQRCAFVQFTTRESAEKAAESSYDKLILHGKRLTVNWGKPASQMESEEGGMRNLLPVPGLPVPSITSQLPLPPPPPGGFMIPPPAPIPLVPHKVSISSMPGPSEPLPPGVVSSGDNASRSMPSHSGAYYSLPPGMSLPPPLPAINLPPPKLPNIAPPVDAGGSKPIGIHYPSMDPGRMGSYSRKTTDA